MSFAGNQIFESLVAEIRALDQWGAFKKQSDEELIIRRYIKTSEQLRSIPLTADVDEAMLGIIRLYLQALALVIEKQSGVLTSVALDINHEGFGRGIVYSGSIVAIEKIFRDSHRFHFSSIEELITKSQKLIDQGLEVLRQYQLPMKLSSTSEAGSSPA